MTLIQRRWLNLADAEFAERLLVRHYLYSDGPFGAGPFTYLDASKEELAEAFGTEPEQALQILLAACGGDEEVHGVLSRGWAGAPADSETPGYFRFLVLTCAVVAGADDNRDTHEFGANLRRLYGSSREFNMRTALPGLWARLVLWIEAGRQRGMPLRPVALPEPEKRHPLIGMTNAVSFPGWQDVGDLRGYFKNNPGAAKRIRQPEDAARVLASRVNIYAGYRPQMVSAAFEYIQLYNARASLLGLHRFWSVVLRALQLSAEKPADAGRMRAELEIPDGLTQVRLLVCLSERDGSEPEDQETQLSVEVDCAVAALESWVVRGRRAVAPLLDAFRQGIVSFTAERLGVLVFNRRTPASGDRLFLLVASTKAARMQVPKPMIRNASSRWTLLGPLDASQAIDVLRTVGEHYGSTGWCPLTVEGGVRCRLGWLGRPSLLPSLHREGKGPLSLTPGNQETLLPTLQELRPGRIELFASSPLEGQYVIRLDENATGVGLAYERRMRFEADAPEHVCLRGPGEGWFEPQEVAPSAWEKQDLAYNDGAFDGVSRQLADPRYDDFLEALYVRAGSGIGGADFVTLTEAALNGPWAWDVARSLCECGWLRQTAARNWRAVRFWLLEPTLIPLTVGDQAAAVLQGSAPAVIRRRFSSHASSLGARVVFSPGASPWSPATCLAIGVDAAQLAAELGWQCQPPKIARPLRAPDCWSVGADGSQHGRVQVWD